MKGIKDIERKDLIITDHSVEEWKEEALEYLRDVRDNFDLHSMNPTSNANLHGQFAMLEAMIEFIENN